MPLSTRHHPVLRTNVGVPIYGCDIYKAYINGVGIHGLFVPIQGGVSTVYSNDISMHKLEGWVSLVDYDSPMYSVTLSCIYTRPRGIPQNNFTLPNFDNYGNQIIRNPISRTNWAFIIGDIWRFEVDESSDRGAYNPSYDFVGKNLLLQPGTKIGQPANNFWQFNINFVNLLGSPAMHGGKSVDFFSDAKIDTGYNRPQSDTTPKPTAPGRIR